MKFQHPKFQHPEFQYPEVQQNEFQGQESPSESGASRRTARSPELVTLHALTGPGSARHGAAQYGGKAAHLGQLARAGLPVPPGFAISAQAFRAFLEHHHLSEPTRPAVPVAAGAAPWPPAFELELKRLRAKVCEAPLLPAFDAQLVQAYEALERQCPGLSVAVRSSGLSEDSAQASFAGQYDSVLNIRGIDALRRAVREVWASYFSDRAVRYRLKPDYSPAYDLGLLVQQLVEPAASGVLFTLNPVTGARHEMLLEAGYGLGEAFVSGQLTPDTFYLGRSRLRWRGGKITVTGRRVVHKPLKLASKPGGAGTLELLPVPLAQQDAPTLAPEQVEQLGLLGLRIEHLFKAPQDIEWAIDAAGKLFILQARPITSCLSRRYSRRDTVLWTRRFSGERWTESATPLGWSIIAPVLEHFVAFEQVSSKHLQGSGPVRLVEGHPYFNITIFRHLVWKFYDYAPPQFILEFFPREEQEEMRAAPFIVPNLALVKDIVVDVIRERRWRRYHYNFLTNHSAWESFLPGFLRAIDALPTETADAHEARAAITLGADWVREYVRIHLLSLLFANLYYQLLTGQLHRWVGENTDQLLSDLVAWPGENKTLETNRALSQLAEVARQSPAVRACLLQEGTVSLEALRAVPGGETFETSLRVFLSQYGHRASASWEIFSPRWEDEPERVVQMIASLLRAGQEPGSAQDNRAALQSDKPGVPASELNRAGPDRLELERMLARQQAEALVWAKVTAQQPLKRLMLRHVLEKTRAYMVLRENQRFYFDKLLLKIKRAAESLGRHWQREGRLERAEDILFLTLDEIDSVLTGAHLSPLLPLIAQRRAEQAQARVSNPPAFLEGNQELTPVQETPGKTLSGLGISPGRITGTVRILNSWQEMDKLRQGDILVTRATDPGWTFLFLTAGGLITEMGSLLSHGAVVAREYNLPAVVNIADATRLLKDGQQITLDGFRGRVYVH